MLSLALLIGKVAFLAVLYLFVVMVVRSGARDLKALAEASAAPGRAQVDRERPGVSPAAASAGARTAPVGRAWALIVEASPVLAVGSAVMLQPGERIVIGRAPESDVVLSDTFVSARHASVTAEVEGLVLEDLDSTNGTLVGGREVEGRLFVGPDERVAIGDTVFVVEER